MARPKRRGPAGWLRLLTALFCAAPSLQQETTTPPQRAATAAAAALPADLPALRWQQRAEIAKCCAEGEALALRPGQEEPSCVPAPPDQRWKPWLLNGRSLERQPPDARSVVAPANVSCGDADHFWLDSTNAGEQFELLTTGHLYLRRSDAIFAPGSFCADRLLGAASDGAAAAQAARVCTVSLDEFSSLLDASALQPACSRGTCLRKCCPRGLKARRADLACVPQTGDEPWRPTFYRALTEPVELSDYHTVPGNALCRSDNGSLGEVFPLEPAFYDEEEFFVQEDGRLWVPDQMVTIGLADFCIDQVEYNHSGRVVDYHIAIICFGDQQQRVHIGTYVYRVLLLLSALFLLATFVVYVAVPELQNLHGRCLISHVAALFTAYACILAGQLRPVYSSMAACQTAALVMYFSFLAACFWLNAMSFDIWLTFSRIRSTSPNSKKTRRFVKYSLYCWCSPLALTVLVIIMQFLPNDVAPPEDVIRPRLGQENCWFPGSWELLVYFHAPILVLMTANVVFFVLTARNLLKTEKDTRMASKQKKGAERFKIYVNLFIVMGITWIAEALSMHLGPKELWFATDVINSLQGFFIFLLFTLRQNTRHIIQRHLASSPVGRWCRCCWPDGQLPGASTSSRKTGSSSLPSNGSKTSAGSGKSTKTAV